MHSSCRAVLYVGILGLGHGAQAAVTLDGTLGPAGPLAGPDYLIPAALGETHNANLFHSFGQFSITSGESVTFTGPDSIQNIIGRVTGGEVSSIDGLLRSTIPGADLYLINPSGIVFGANAQLDVSGSFYASSADYLRLTDGGRFDARDPGASILSMAPPAAFGFLGGTPAPLSVAGSLSVPVGETLSLIGGDITIRGEQAFLDASSGRIDLISVRSAGELALDSSAPDVTAFTVLGEVVIDNAAGVTTAGDPGGTIYIRSGRLVVESAKLDSATVGATDHAGTGIDIAVRGEVVLGVSADPAVRIGGVIDSSSFDAGRAGDIRIEAGSLRLAGDPIERGDTREGIFSEIASRAYLLGRGGDIALGVTDLEVGTNASIVTESQDTGDAGNISVNANSLRVDGSAGFGSFISSSSGIGGRTGNLTISAADVVLLGDSGLRINAGEPNSGRDSGTLTLTADRLQLLDGAQISTSYLGAGSGGHIDVTANEVLIAGTHPEFASSAGIFSDVFSTAAGIPGENPVVAGNITVTAGNLSMSQAGMISSSVSAREGASTGNIRIAAQNMDLSDGALIASYSSGVATGGISINAARLRLVGGGETLTNSGPARFGTGAAIIVQAGGRGGDSGGILIDSGDLQILDGARIDASGVGTIPGGAIGIRSDRVLVAGRDAASGEGAAIVALSSPISFPPGPRFSGAGGDIDIVAGELVVRDFGNISAQSFSGNDAGGLRIAADSISLTNHAQVSAAATILGKAGSVEIVARDVLYLRDSEISVLAVNSTGGNIDIDAGALLDLNNSLITTSVKGVAGSGGNLRIAADTILLSGNTSITATAQVNDGIGGNIELLARDALYMRDSTISTQAGVATGGNFGSSVGFGGNIAINARSIIHLSASSITASALGGAGNGGNIAIDPDFVVLNHSHITANAFGGNGGNVTIVAGNFVASSDSSVTASSALGLQGNVVIQSPAQDLSGDLEKLPETALDASTRFKPRCAAVGSRFSSFTVSGPSVAGTGLGMMSSSYSEIGMDIGSTTHHNGSPRSASLATVDDTLPAQGCRI